MSSGTQMKSGGSFSNNWLPLCMPCREHLAIPEVAIFMAGLVLSMGEANAVSPSEARRLARNPEAKMIDSETCELRDAVADLQTGKLSGAGYGVALFRGPRAKKPFLAGETLADSTVTFIFPAKPGEAIFARAAEVNLDDKSVRWGLPMRVVCRNAGSVDVGVPVPVTSEASK